LDNSAEQLFGEMEEKNGDTYEALIQGLVKVRGPLSSGTFCTYESPYAAQEFPESV
jgi:hypothetical protein